jgi:septum site-determining protein MinD
MLLVVNRVLESFDFDELRQQVEQTYRIAVAGVLPSTDDLIRLASSDIFSLRYPEHRWSREIVHIADALTAP